jgi:hypothetical protein
MKRAAQRRSTEADMVNEKVPAPKCRLNAHEAIAAHIKAPDRLDRYQRAAKVNQVYDDEARKRLFDKINRVAVNLGYDHAKTAAESKDSEASAGSKDEKEKTPWGVGASH